jgi:hypothetical protein
LSLIALVWRLFTLVNVLYPNPDVLHAPAAMAEVEVTRHLKEYFPQLASTPVSLEASTVSDLILKLEAMAPGFAFYVCDERGRLRQHVNIFVADQMIVDRQRLSDRIDSSTRVFITQALSGG